MIKITILNGLLAGFLAIALNSPKKGFDHEHADWTAVLQEVVVTNGAASQVKYKRLQRNSITLNKYLKGLSKLSKAQFDSFSESERMAFLINAYNAFTMKLVLDHYPVSSIKKIGGAFSSAWKMKFIRLFGKDITLDDIENKMLRQNFSEARVHFAINFASVDCPSLLPKAYTAEKLNTQLDEQVRLFMRDDSRNRLDVAGKSLQLSKIFDWFKEDFIKSAGSVQKFVSTYITDDVNVQAELMADAYTLKFLDYNWDLNDVDKK